jgi:hypothetical protein
MITAAATGVTEAGFDCVAGLGANELAAEATALLGWLADAAAAGVPWALLDAADFGAAPGVPDSERVAGEPAASPAATALTGCDPVEASAAPPAATVLTGCDPVEASAAPPAATVLTGCDSVGRCGTESFGALGSAADAPAG